MNNPRKTTRSDTGVELFPGSLRGPDSKEKIGK